MAEFSSEMGSFIQQKRDRNKRVTEEHRAKMAGAAGQLSRQVGQKIGWTQAAEQVNVLGRQNLPNWQDIGWADIASRGVDPYVQDINFQIQQGQYTEATGKPPTEEVGGETTDLTTPKMQNILKLDASKAEIRNDMQNKYGDDLTGNPLYEEIVNKIKKATNANIADIGYEVEKEIKQLESFVSRGEKIRENTAKFGKYLNMDKYNNMYMDNPVKAKQSLTNDWIRLLADESGAVLELKGELAEGKIGKELIKLSKDDNAKLVMGALSDIDEFAWMFDSNKVITEAALVQHPEMLLKINSMATDFGNTTSATTGLISTYKNKIAKIDSDIENILTKAGNNKNIKDKDYAILAGLNSGSYEIIDGMIYEKTSDNVSGKRVEGKREDYIIEEYNEIATLKLVREGKENLLEEQESNKMNVLTSKAQGIALDTDIAKNYIADKLTNVDNYDFSGEAKAITTPAEVQPKVADEVVAPVEETEVIEPNIGELPNKPITCSFNNIFVFC